MLALVTLVTNVIKVTNVTHPKMSVSDTSSAAISVLVIVKSNDPNKK